MVLVAQSYMRHVWLLNCLAKSSPCRICNAALKCRQRRWQAARGCRQRRWRRRRCGTPTNRGRYKYDAEKIWYNCAPSSSDWQCQKGRERMPTMNLLLGSGPALLIGASETPHAVTFWLAIQASGQATKLSAGPPGRGRRSTKVNWKPSGLTHTYDDEGESTQRQLPPVWRRVASRRQPMPVPNTHNGAFHELSVHTEESFMHRI